MTMEQPLFSIVIPAKNEGKNVLHTLQSILHSANHSSYEIIIIDDNSADHCCNYIKEYINDKNIRLTTTTGIGLAPAKQLGARLATGKILLFCDAHVFVEDRWLDKLAEPLLNEKADALCPGIAPHDQPNAIGYGQIWDSNLAVNWLGRPEGLTPVPLLPGGCMAIKAQTFWDVGGFDEGFRVWGYEDGELSLKLWLMGFQVCTLPEVVVLHIFRRNFPYRVSMEHVNYNLLRMAYTHFNEERIKKVSQLAAKNGAIEDLVQEVLNGGALTQKAGYDTLRKYDDNWYFEKFEINF